ncbi:hypothetical protein ABEX78_21750 [Priestia megaterium]
MKIKEQLSTEDKMSIKNSKERNKLIELYDYQELKTLKREVENGFVPQEYKEFPSIYIIDPTNKDGELTSMQEVAHIRSVKRIAFNVNDIPLLKESAFEDRIEATLINYPTKNQMKEMKNILGENKSVISELLKDTNKKLIIEQTEESSGINLRVVNKKLEPFNAEYMDENIDFYIE